MIFTHIFYFSLHENEFINNSPLLLTITLKGTKKLVKMLYLLDNIFFMFFLIKNR